MSTVNKSVFVGMILVLVFTPAATAAVTDAGLVNGNFEGGGYDDPDGDHRTGDSWSQFTLSGYSKHDITWLGPTAHSPVYVQDFWEETFTSGIYQTVANTHINSLYTGSTWIQGSGITFWIGLDPTGGTNPSSANVDWSSSSVGTSSWTQISKQTAAQSSSITLFLKATKTGGAAHALFDDAAMVVPEPATLSLFILGGLAILRRRRHAT